MVSRRRSAYATMAGSTASTLIAALQSLVLLPLYLSEIGVGLYGAWLATGEVLVWLLAFDFGIPNLLIQRTGASLARGDYRAIGSQFAASLLSLFAIAATVGCGVWSGAPWIASVVGGSEELVGAIRIGVVATVLTLVSYGFVGLARGMQRTGIVQGFALAGTVVGFAVTALMLLEGFGLVSIAWGLVARSSFALLGGLTFFALRTDRRVVQSCVPRAESLRDIARHCPPMFAAGIGYALMNNSMVTLAAVMFRPELATVLGVTRKAADLVRMVLDMVGHASYGGFAHLSASGDGVRTRIVYRELQATFFLVGTALLAAYVASNEALVSVWVGSRMFGGFGLTLVLAVATVVGSWSYLQIGLYRAMGHHGAASSALLVECGARLGLMVFGGYLFGLAGLAGAVVVTAVVSGVWASRRIARELGSADRSGKEWALRIAPFALAAAVGALGASGGWWYVVGVATAVGLVAASALVFFDPALATFRKRIVGGSA